jgi:hypothetical protein
MSRGSFASLGARRAARRGSAVRPVHCAGVLPARRAGLRAPEYRRGGTRRGIASRLRSVAVRDACSLRPTLARRRRLACRSDPAHAAHLGLEQCLRRLSLLVHSVFFLVWHLRTFTLLPSLPIALVVATVLFLAGTAWGYQVQRDGTILWSTAQHSLFLVVMSMFDWA